VLLFNEIIGKAPENREKIYGAPKPATPLGGIKIEGRDDLLKIKKKKKGDLPRERFSGKELRSWRTGNPIASKKKNGESPKLKKRSSQKKKPRSSVPILGKKRRD